MATIESYEIATGKRYMVRYRTPGRTQTKKRGFKTKRDAAEFAATVEVEKMTGAYVAPSAGRITIGQLGPEWLDRQKAHTAASSQRSRESAWRVHVSPRWAKTRISDVKATDVQAWIASYPPTHRPGVERALGLRQK